MIIHSLKKYGITKNVDGSENNQINIRGLEDYVMPAPEKGFYLETSSSEESEDEKWAIDNEDNRNNNDTDFEGSSTSDDESEY